MADLKIDNGELIIENFGENSENASCFIIKNGCLP